MDATAALEKRVDDEIARVKELLLELKDCPQLAQKFLHGLSKLADRDATSVDQQNIACIVMLMDGTSFNLDIAAFENVLSLKRRIEAQCGMLPEDQELSLADVKRNPLADYEILRSLITAGSSTSEVNIALMKKLGVLRTLDTETIFSGCNIVALDFTTEHGSQEGAADFLYGSNAAEKCELLCSYFGESGSQLKNFDTHNGNIERSMAFRMLSELRNAGPCSSLESLVVTHNAVQFGADGSSNFADVAIANLLSASFPALLTLDVSENFELVERAGFKESFLLRAGVPLPEGVGSDIDWIGPWETEGTRMDMIKYFLLRRAVAVVTGFIPLAGGGIGESLAYTGPMLAVTLTVSDRPDARIPVAITATATEGRLQLLVRLNKLSLRHSMLDAPSFFDLPVQKFNPVKVGAVLQDPNFLSMELPQGRTALHYFCQWRSTNLVALVARHHRSVLGDEAFERILAQKNQPSGATCIELAGVDSALLSALNGTESAASVEDEEAAAAAAAAAVNKFKGEYISDCDGCEEDDGGDLAALSAIQFQGIADSGFTADGHHVVKGGVVDLEPAGHTV
jgi:hypothetical protein